MKAVSAVHLNCSADCCHAFTCILVTILHKINKMHENYESRLCHIQRFTRDVATVARAPQPVQVNERCGL